MKRLATAVLMTTLACASLTLALAARADEHRDGGRHEEGRSREPARGHEGGRWHGGIERFHERDFHTWREGHWEHRWRDGRYGWWWNAGGLWYIYPTPIYPYPDPYLPPVVVAPPVASAPVEPAAPPPAQYWYFCDSAGGYYPYVPTCPSGWRAVPANPAR
jgi:hypothetical protein